MKKLKIVGIVIAAAALIGVALFQVVPALADAPVLDHVLLTPSTAALNPGTTQQFTAQGVDAANAPIPGLSYFWMVTIGGGTINTTGLFTAGTTPGTYANTVQAVVVQGSITKVANATIIVNSVVAGALDHITVTPASATVAPSGTQQFTAQGYDSTNIAITGLTYTWSATAGGTINTTGLFTVGTVTGTFTNAVQATASQVTSTGTITKTGLASVTVSTTPTTTPAPKLDVQKLIKMFTGYFRGADFDNFLGGQWQVKNGTAIDTIKVIPGVVQVTSAASLTVLPNGQTTPATFTIGTGTTILPKGTTLAVNDKVVVVTVNDQPTLVVKVVAPTGDEPPGLRKHDDDKREGKKTPPGWSRGNKTGWDKESSDDEDD